MHLTILLASESQWQLGKECESLDKGCNERTGSTQDRQSTRRTRPMESQEKVNPQKSNIGFSTIFDIPIFRETVTREGLEKVIESAKQIIERACRLAASIEIDAMPSDVAVPVCNCGLEVNEGVFLNNMTHRPDCPAYTEPSSDLAACTVCKTNHNEVGEAINGPCYCNCHD